MNLDNLNNILFRESSIEGINVPGRGSRKNQIFNKIERKGVGVNGIRERGELIESRNPRILPNHKNLVFLNKIGALIWIC